MTNSVSLKLFIVISFLVIMLSSSLMSCGRKGNLYLVDEQNESQVDNSKADEANNKASEN